MKALCVFSGGLDSMLAAALLRAQGIQVTALFFKTPFFGAERAESSARAMGLPLEVVDITSRHLPIVKHPPHGRGRNMNPCLDCHALMFRIAGEMLEPQGALFLATGEVLGQRPMSQNRKALDLVAKMSGYADLILRPLSAKRLPSTLPEREGWVERERLEGFQGRSRKPQMQLAKALGIKEWPSPAGGCLLTDEGFSRRLRDLLEIQDDPEVRWIELLKWGRHFRLGPRTRLVVGRHRRDNERIRDLAGPDPLLWTSSVPGPTGALVGEVSREILQEAARVVAAYSDAALGEKVSLAYRDSGGTGALSTTAPSKDAFRDLLV